MGPDKVLSLWDALERCPSCLEAQKSGTEAKAREKEVVCPSAGKAFWKRKGRGAELHA